MNSAFSIFMEALEQVEKARKDISQNGLSYEILSHINHYMDVELNGDVFPKSKEEFQKLFTVDAIIRLYLWDVYLYLSPDYSKDLAAAGKEIGIYSLDEYMDNPNIDMSDFAAVKGYIKETYPTDADFEKVCDWVDLLDANSHCVTYEEYDPCCK